MTSSATLLKERLPAISASPTNNTFLDALRHIDYGQLTIITPQETHLNFMGAKAGPVATMAIKDWEVFDDLIGRGEIGFAEAYIEGRWDSPDLPMLLTFGLVNNESLEHFFHGKPFYAAWLRLKAALRENSLSGSRRNIMEHYDLGNDFYALWLDESMTYSSGLFQGDIGRSLEHAQQAKYERILDKLGARQGDHILELGCGWGGFARAAAKHGIRVTGVTISPEQAIYATNRNIKEGFDPLISIELRDYRETQGEFDYVVSIGMFEHVGEKFWPEYFKTVRKRLKPMGKAMVQSITLDNHLFEDLRGVNGFIETYIFPGGMLPSKFRFREAAEKSGLACQEMFGFGQDYATTLEHWRNRFIARREDVRKMGYDERFLRMWDFYLSSCMASFISERTDVIQAELTPEDA